MSWARGSTRAWRRVRRRVLQANVVSNGGRCTLQLAGVCQGQATHVHHVLGRAVTGDDPRYLTAACAACNLHIGEPGKGEPDTRQVSSW